MTGIEFVRRALRRVSSVPSWGHGDLPPLGALIRIGHRVDRDGYRIRIESGDRGGEPQTCSAHYLRHYTARVDGSGWGNR